MDGGWEALQQNTTNDEQGLLLGIIAVALFTNIRRQSPNNYSDSEIFSIPDYVNGGLGLFISKDKNICLALD